MNKIKTLILPKSHVLLKRLLYITGIFIKTLRRILIINLLIMVIIPYSVFIIPISGHSSLQNVEITHQFNKYDAYNYLEDQIDLGNRIPGTQARKDCANYFIAEFQKIDPGFSYFSHNFTVLGVDCQNVLFKMNEQYKNILILGAHYDSRAKATKDSSDPTSPVPGANDGASGSAVLIELADIFYSNRDELECQIWFLFFDAEDQGKDIAYGIKDWEWCEGSQKFVQDIDNYYDTTTEHFDCMILLDMVGGGNLEFINELNSRSSLLDELFIIGRSLGYTDTFPQNPISQAITDDHVAFNSLGIPTADLIIEFWGSSPSWPYHHTTEDNLDHISRDSLEITGKTVEQFIYNNYYVYGTYHINYPWYDDYNPLSLEMIIFIIGIIAILGISILILNLNHRNNIKKLRELKDLNQD